MSEPQTPEERLAAIKAERAKLAEARDAREAAKAVETELEDEAQKLRDDQAIAAAEEEYGPLDRKIAAVHTAAGVVIVKKPNHVLFKRFQDSGEASAAEFIKLVKPCVVYPDKPAFDALLEDQPGVLGAITAAVCRLAGVKLKEVSGK